MKKYIIIFLILLIGCHLDNTTLRKDSRINKIFTKDEVKSLQIMLSYFDNHLLDFTNTTIIDSAYNIYSRKLMLTKNDKEFHYLLNPIKSFKKDFTNTFKNDSVFKHIWNIKYQIKNSDTLDFSYKFKVYEKDFSKSKFMKFFDYIVEKDTAFSGYQTDIENGGGSITPPYFCGYHNYHKKLNFNDESIRLFTAFHYITLRTYREK